MSGKTGRGSLFFLEVIGLTALFTTGEVDWAVILAALFLPPILGRIVGRHLPARWLLALLFSVLAGAVLIWIWKRTPPILLAAHGAAFFHGLLWASFGSYRYWRGGLAFLDLLVAVSLSPGIHHFGLALCFLPAALHLAIVSHAADEAAAHGVKPGVFRFRRYGSFFALGVLACAAAVFPVLPRANWGIFTDPRRVDVGYTEEVRTSDWNVGVLQDNPRVLLRFSWPRSADVDPVRWRLIRGKVLEKFDGDRWRPGVKYPAAPSGTVAAEGLRVLAVRESIGSDVLPVPYGVSSLELDGARRRRQATGEWVESNPARRRAEYRFELPGRREALRDPPREVHREAMASDELATLARRLARGATTPEAMARSVGRHLSRGYVARLGADQIPSASGRSPVDDFLFQTKAGHCEAFATAGALLLRKMGVAARLVVGFRPGRAPRDGLLEVRGRDSHAWVEFWNGSEWREFDPTPVLLLENSPLGEFEDLWDLLNSLWYRWVLDFDPREVAVRDLALRTMLVLSAVLAAFAILRVAMHSGVWLRPRPVRERLVEERDRMERAAAGGHSGWMARYLELRFGAREPEECDREELRRWRREIVAQRKARDATR